MTVDLPLADVRHLYHTCTISSPVPIQIWKSFKRQKHEMFSRSSKYRTTNNQNRIGANVACCRLPSPGNKHYLRKQR
jgi:hypothetical protein